MYEKMPSRLVNVGETFERAIVIAFVGGKYKFIVIYLDDITMFSQSNNDHLSHLNQTF